MNTPLKNWLVIFLAFIVLIRLSDACAKSYIWGVIDADLRSVDTGVEYNCTSDVQCQNRTWGYHSRCSNKTARCECQDQSGSERETVRIKNGTCVIRMRLGDPCNAHKECESIPGEAYCHSENYDSTSGRKKYYGLCQCKETSVWHSPSGECLLKATQLGDPCEVSDQCRNGTLGNVSTCDTGKCACMSSGDDLNTTQSIYYERLKKCFVQKEYNDSCTEDDECRANLGPDVKCGQTEYSETNVCHCPQGNICRRRRFSRGFSRSFSFKLIAGITVLVIVIEAVCLVWCCCIRSKRLHRKRAAVVRAEKGTTSDGVGQTVTVVTAQGERQVGAIANSRIAGKKLYPDREKVSAAVPLLQPQQPVLYANLPQPMSTLHPLTREPSQLYPPNSI